MPVGVLHGLAAVFQPFEADQIALVVVSGHLSLPVMAGEGPSVSAVIR